MNIALIACATLKDEIEMVMDRHKITYDYMAFVDSGMHNTSSRLQEAVKAKLADMEAYYDRLGRKPDRLLLCFGLCGNMIEGLELGDYETWVPKTDDCITWMLGSVRRKRKIDRKKRGYYLTAGWLKGEANLRREYAMTVSMYGKSMADEIFEEMLHGYETIYLLDTGAGDFDRLAREGRAMAEDFNKEVDALEADLAWFERYLLQDFAGLMDEEKVIRYPAGAAMHFTDYI